jgi:hypothetical protein
MLRLAQPHPQSLLPLTIIIIIIIISNLWLLHAYYDDVCPADRRCRTHCRSDYYLRCTVRPWWYYIIMVISLYTIRSREIRPIRIIIVISIVIIISTLYKVPERRRRHGTHKTIVHRIIIYCIYIIISYRIIHPFRSKSIRHRCRRRQSDSRSVHGIIIIIIIIISTIRIDALRVNKTITYDFARRAWRHGAETIKVWVNRLKKNCCQLCSFESCFSFIQWNL